LPQKRPALENDGIVLQSGLTGLEHTYSERRVTGLGERKRSPH